MRQWKPAIRALLPYLCAGAFAVLAVMPLGAQSPPTNVSLTPSSGSGPSRTFSFVVSSPNGYAYLDWVQMVFNYTTEGAGGCFLHYARAANVLYLLSDDGGTWAGAGSLGVTGAGSIQNSQCQVNLETSSPSAAGNELTLNLALTFTASFIGPQGVFLRASDLGGMGSNWQQMGTWTAYAAPCSSPPAAVSVSPSTGSGTTQTFRYVASSCNGYAYIPSISVLVNNVVDGAHACSLYYNRASNYFVLINDANDGWAGSGPPGAAATIENTQCNLDLANSSVAGTGNNLVVDFALTFKPVFNGVKNNYLYVTDRSNQATGWQQVGTWTVPGGSLSISASSAAFQGGGGTGTITVTAGSTTSWTATASQPWVTVTSPATGTGNGTVSYSVDVNSSGAERSATITFEPGAVAFTITEAGLVPQPPVNVSLNPSSGSGPSGTFSFVVSSPNGYAHLDWVQMVFNYATEGAGGCFLHYARAANVVYLLSDDGGSWAGAGSVGVAGAGSIQNSQCQVNLETSSVSAAGNELTLNVVLTFTPSFIGPQGAFLRAGDLGGMSSNWQQMGAWTAYAAPCSSPPSAVSVSPSTGSGTTQTFRYVASSCNGYAYISSISALVNNVVDGAHACSLYYNRASNYFVLMNDANDGWAGFGAAGQAGTIENTQCSLDLTSSSAASTGNNVTVDFALTFKPVLNGAKNNYLSVTDRSNLTSGYQQLGTWTVTGPAPPPGVGTISGTVTQSGGSTPIAGATIQAFQGGVLLGSASSGGTGAYAIGSLATGSYGLMCSAAGRKTEIRSPVQVSDQTTTIQNFSLSPQASGGRSVKEYVYADSSLVAIEQGPAPFVDFEQFSGSNAGDVALPPVTVGIVTFSGGQIFSGSPDVPGNSTVVYGSRNQGCTGCLQTITIDFAQPVSEVGFTLYNGSSAYPVHYVVQDDRGYSQDYPFYSASYSSTGVGSPKCSIRRVTIFSNTGTAWAFWLDNLSYAIGDLGAWCQ